MGKLQSKTYKEPIKEKRKIDNSKHKELCNIAEKWLRSFGCSVVFNEFSSSTSEIPDAIGWKSGYSILIEAKTSRSDFLADFKKPHRIYPEIGAGEYRLYICEKDLIKKEELPDGWGLLYVDPFTKKVRREKCWKGNTTSYAEEAGMKHFTPNFRAERTMLLSRIRRAQLGYGEL